MLLAEVYFTMGCVAAIACIIMVLKNKDVFFPKKKK